MDWSASARERFNTLFFSYFGDFDFQRRKAYNGDSRIFSLASVAACAFAVAFTGTFLAAYLAGSAFRVKNKGQRVGVLLKRAGTFLKSIVAFVLRVIRFLIEGAFEAAAHIIMSGRNNNNISYAKRVSSALDVKATADALMKSAASSSASKRSAMLQNAKGLYEQSGTELLRLAKATGNNALLVDAERCVSAAERAKVELLRGKSSGGSGFLDSVFSWWGKPSASKGTSPSKNTNASHAQRGNPAPAPQRRPVAAAKPAPRPAPKRVPQRAPRRDPAPDRRRAPIRRPAAAKKPAAARRPAGAIQAKNRSAHGSKSSGADKKFDEMILSEIVDKSPSISWEDIAGLSFAKRTLMEAVILPTLRPDIFTGLRAPPKGVLLFGPPGTGKTMLAKAVATESKATFFSISASSLTSKWVGESEKLVRALFRIARQMQPSVIFIDEIDSVLTKRSSGEHEGSRRLKTEFMVQLDGVVGAASGENERVLVMGATNCPDELDDAVIRRLVKRIYVPLPDKKAREALFTQVLKKNGGGISLSRTDMRSLVGRTDGYSGSDLNALCKEAALGPVREWGNKIARVAARDVRAIQLKDFNAALTTIRPSVPAESLRKFEKWNADFGSYQL